MRSDRNRTRWMVLGGESYSLYSLEDRKPTQEASFLCVPPCMGWVVCQIQGSQHKPTTHSLPISSEFLFGMWGLPFQFSSIHSLRCHFGNWVSIEIRWTLHFTCVFCFCLNAYGHISPYIIWYKNLTLQGCWHWRLQSKPENCWLCRPLCWNQHEFGKGDHELQMKWLGSVIVNTILLIFYVGLFSPASQDSSGKRR